MKVESIAKICHETNRAYCETLGDNTQASWESAADWQKESAIKGVEFRIANPSATAADMHQSWLDEKIAQGWIYGSVKDAEKRLHPCMLPYAELPIDQRRKDYLFSAVVIACLADSFIVSKVSQPSTKKGGTMAKKKIAKKTTKKSVKSKSKSKAK